MREMANDCVEMPSVQKYDIESPLVGINSCWFLATVQFDPKWGITISISSGFSTSQTRPAYQ